MRKPVSALLAVVMLLALFVGCSPVAENDPTYNYDDMDRIVQDPGDDQGVGDVGIRTLQVPENVNVLRAHYSATGKVLISYWTKENGKMVRGLAVMNDDGTDWRSVFQGDLGGSKLLPYADNTRVLTGDTVIQCPEGYTLDTCPENAAQVYPIEYPEEFTSDKRVIRLWSEVIIAPDNIHMAWTTLRSDCGAVVAIGELVQDGSSYRIDNYSLCSRMNTWLPDPDHEGYLLHSSVIGGEVKQFVHGGTAISLVGADTNGDSQSVTLDISTGEYTMITKTLGYDETTIFSPSEEYGMVMTTRFSPATRMDFLGLVPRPYGDPLFNITNTIYMYSVSGVRKEREGNIGPALINIEKSMADPDYMGLDLSDPEGEWVYGSPMSWNADSTRAMWMEKQRGGAGVRVQIATLMKAKPSKAVSSVTTPDVGDYADKDSAVDDLAGKVAGKTSGWAEFIRETSGLGEQKISITYHDYSDDGEYFFNGTESGWGSVITETVYSSDVVVTDAKGSELGRMDVELYWGPAYQGTVSGSGNPHLDTERSHATATWKGVTLTGDSLIE